jgi:eukaryotic-like serine/threonine-protein kinase
LLTLLLKMHSADGVTRVWDAEGGGRLHRLECPGASTHAVAVYKEHVRGDNRIATGMNDGRLLIWDAQGGTLLRLLPAAGDEYGISSLAAYESAAGPWRLVTGSYDYAIRVWDPEAGRLLHTMDGHPSVVCQLHLFESEAGRWHLVSGGTIGDVALWDLEEAPRRLPVTRSAKKTG